MLDCANSTSLYDTRDVVGSRRSMPMQVPYSDVGMEGCPTLVEPLVLPNIVRARTVLQWEREQASQNGCLT